MTAPTYRVDHLPVPIEQFGTYRKVSTTAAVRIRGPFRCFTSEGDAVKCDDGWLAIDAHGYPYPINAAEFAAIYEPDDGDQLTQLRAELERLRTYEADISAAVSAYRATDPDADTTLTGVVFGAQQALDAETLAARAGAADV